MMFYLNLVCFIYCFDKTIGFLNTEYVGKHECSVRIETDNGFEICFNHQCSDYKDPWRIVQSFLEDKPCYLHYLKLSFSNYDQFIVFVELQTTNNNSLENFFADENSEQRFLEIEIDNIYPFNSHYFLREDMLSKLGGTDGRIHILKIKVNYWYRSIRSVIQLIKNDMIERQPFQQIIVSYPCNILQTRVQLILIKYLQYQEESSCPTQIKIVSEKNVFRSNYEQKYMKENQSIDINNYGNISIKKSDIKSISLNKSYSHYDKKKKLNRINLFAMIAIPFILIMIIIVFIIYYFITAHQ